MELLPVIIKVLFVIGAIFLIVLIASYLISKFRKDKEEVITESYPAEKYKYYSGNDSDSQSQFPMNQFYYIEDDTPIDGYNPGYERIDQYSSIGQNQIYNYPVMQYEDSADFGNNWVDYEEENYFTNPLRKTSSINFNAVSDLNGNLTGRMTIVNNEPLFKYGWK